MIRAEEYRQTVFRASGVTVDGVVRVRRFRASRGGARVLIEQRVPVAVLVSRDGREERVPFTRGPEPRVLMALLAIPIAARLAARLLSHR